MLVLAGITIRTLTGENGLIENAGRAKEETEIANEKEIIERAIVQAMRNNKYGDIEESELQKQLDKETGQGKTDTTDIGNEFEVIFIENNRYYTVDKDGNIRNVQLIVEDKSPGDITKDEKGNDIEEGEPYEIWCIEDLVAFSNMVSGKGIILENDKPVEIKKAVAFSNKTVELKRSLNFKSKLSYVNSNRTDFGDINGINDDGNILINEMASGAGFNSINGFNGIFDGKGNEINNLYLSDSPTREGQHIGFFSKILSNTVIQNLSINANIICNNSENSGIYVGGVIGNINHSSDITLKNNKFNGKIEGGRKICGGILGRSDYISNLKIDNCMNLAEITSDNSIGGIIGHFGLDSDSEGVQITNCFNIGNMKITSGASDRPYSAAGGILGSVGCQGGSNSTEIKVFNSYNKGNIDNQLGHYYNGAGGIIGSTTNKGNVTIANCYNTGKTTSKSSGSNAGIQGGFWYNNYLTDIKHCYYDETKSDSGVGGTNIEYAQKLSHNQIIGKEAIVDENGNRKNLVELLNEYIENNSDGFDTSHWCKWTQDEEGYPRFID